ncbi:RNase adapter RapZ [uncultured Muribaculum sp.]|nr:RNase adapter RapZ [uncultured Muribaculum sp.]
MVSFGCTGGQHRSVYSAERMVRHLHEKYNVRVVVDHVEQNMHKVINPKQINR